jgi:hypothetical protein
MQGCRSNLLVVKILSAVFALEHGVRDLHVLVEQWRGPDPPALLTLDVRNLGMLELDVALTLSVRIEDKAFALALEVVDLVTLLVVVKLALRRSNSLLYKCGLV